MFLFNDFSLVYGSQFLRHKCFLIESVGAYLQVVLFGLRPSILVVLELLAMVMFVYWKNLLLSFNSSIG